MVKLAPSDAALPLADKTRRNQRIYHHGQNVMSLINFIMSCHCTVDKDNIPWRHDEIESIRLQTGQRNIPQGQRQTILNMLIFSGFF